VIYEDDYLALIRKPAGILVSGNKFMTVKNALAQNLKKSSQPDATSPQPIHRLDYATTGILLVGKTTSSIRASNKMFENKEIKKSYRAITIGQMEAQGEVCTGIDGKEAKSRFKVLDSVDSERFEKLNLVELIPETGRRHQLRKHLHSIGHPILGDKDYFLDGLTLKGKGMYLHAYSLEFEHPVTKQKLCVLDELPRKFEKIFDSLANKALIQYLA
jgi:23S rRNA pseudouridine1911/1915/1917 synthase